MENLMFGYITKIVDMTVKYVMVKELNIQELNHSLVLLLLQEVVMEKLKIFRCHQHLNILQHQ